MKKLCLFLLFTVAATSCQDFAEVPSGTVKDNSATTRAAGSDGQDYYWYQGEKIYLTVDKGYVNVVMGDASLESPASVSLFEKAGVEWDKSAQFDGMIKLKTISEKASVAEYSRTVDALKRKGQVKYVFPYFERGDGAEPIGTSDIFYLKLKSPEDVGMLKKMADELGVQVIEEIPYTPQWYTLSIIGSDFGSSIEASNHFYETRRFEDVDPAFMFDFKPDADDPEFGWQWGMIGSSSYDINVVPAWAITRGAGVKVAVVDSPIQSEHTDLNDNMHSLSYNAQLKRTPSAAYNPNYYPFYLIDVANHGTHVAGIIAAEKNGSMVTGVAYESKIVRVSHDSYFSSTMASEYASGINWAWKATSAGGAGVDVINCSWGDRDGNHNVHMELHSTVLEQAIVNAMTQGRGGKGCVVVFAAGNSGHLGSIVNYPANFHNNILVVGSIDESGSRSSFSGYGSKLDVVAPGGSIWSTIYNSTTGNMSGTSMAAPHVSGVAALLLSIKPDLTSAQVANIIKQSACKVNRNNPYTYSYHSSHPGGTWNDQMGHGLVDARGAIDFMLNISGPETLLIGSSATYSIAYPPAGFTWEASSNLSLSGSGNSVTVTGIDNGFGSIRILINGTEVVRKSVEVVPPTYRTSLRITNLCDGSNTFEALIVAGEADDYPNSNELVYANNNLTVPYTPYTYQYQYVELDDGTSPDEPGVYLPEGQYTLLLYHQSISTRYYYYVFTVPFEGYLLVEKEGADYWYDWYEPE